MKKQHNTKQLNPNGFNQVLEELAIEVIKNNPDATYSTDEIVAVVDNLLEKSSLKYSHLNELCAFREVFEQRITKKYGVKFSNTFAEDVESKYKKRRVPKLTQVKSGILDALIGKIHLRPFLKMEAI